jgi:glutamate--cysteine ligase
VRSDDLLAPFRPIPGRPQQVGVEIECATLVTGTGSSARYHGPQGTRALLQDILDREPSDPIPGPDGPVGLHLEDGTKITLEAGGAFEYSSPPAPDLVALNGILRERLAGFAEHAARRGLSLVPGGNLPFNTLDDVDWVPEEHSAVLRELCERTGETGLASMEVSTLSVSTQTTLDFSTQRELTERLRVALAAASVAAALFVNSPLLGGQESGLLSWRMSRLLREDPQRFGLPPFAFAEDISAQHFVDWLLGLPMVYTEVGGRCVAASPIPFGELLAEGLVGQEDWNSHVNQAWPFVRPRKTLELRLSDGPPYPFVMAAPAFWVGLLYHAPSLEAAWSLLKGRTVDDHRRTIADVAASGLAASHAGVPVSELVAELLRLSRQGLEARIAGGQERAGVTGSLDVLDEIAAGGKTWAHQQLSRWNNEFDRDPARFVAAYGI